MSEEETERRPVGRPSKYDPVYCQKVIEAGEQGLSLTAFAGMIGVCKATIDTWRAEHPEFLGACKVHQAARTLFLERGMLGEAVTGPYVNARVFALKNAAPDEWRDKIVNEHSGPDGAPIQTQSTVLDAKLLTWDERQKMRELLEAAASRKGKEGG